MLSIDIDRVFTEICGRFQQYENEIYNEEMNDYYIIGSGDLDESGYEANDRRHDDAIHFYKLECLKDMASILKIRDATGLFDVAT